MSRPAPNARRGLPEHWLLPPPPREPALAARFAALPFERRQALARTGPAQLAGLDPADVEVVAGLARARLRTSWRLLTAAPIVGWLVLMTVWGFGRSTAPQDETAWFVAGLLLGAVAWAASAVAVTRRLARARAIVAVSSPPPNPDQQS